MAGDEYSTGGGGKLKLKSKVHDGRVDKKSKKSKKQKQEKSKTEVTTATPEGVESDPGRGLAETTSATTPGESKSPAAGDGGENENVNENESVNKSEVVVGKTETERKYEDARRKRLQERLKREGVKTHKERVEELNKYLSRLSEHHDMPKIGPG